jgi:NADH-quinone oxidoreductase subunit G
MVKIEINGKTIEARDGATVIEAADEAGIVIPRFCYHKKLSIAASCRMCLVEVEKVGKPLPACATPVTEGMKVHTKSPKAIAAQRNVLEFLLINHPLDCPVCDQGGECDLQEVSMGFGKDVSRYTEAKRVVPQTNIGPLIATEMTRCIHCTRCVRFGQEIAGVMEMGGAFRGDHMRIGTFVERTVDSELSGNMIDLCPVGALTSKPFRFGARPWELTENFSVSPHDCVGANLNVETRGGRVMRVLPKENEAINEIWLADRDRFSYPAIYHAERLTAPRIKRDGRWQETDWDTALTFAAEGLARVKSKHGVGQLGALASYTATTEEAYLLQRLMRGMGSNNVDFRLRQRDFRDQEALPAFPGLGRSIQSLEQMDAALIVGSNIRKDQPLLGHRVRKAALGGARITLVNPADYECLFPVATKAIVTPAEMVTALAAVAKALLEATKEAAPAGFDKFGAVKVDANHRAIADALRGGKNGAVLVGNAVAYHNDGSELRNLAALIARLAGATFGQIAEGGNAAGAALAGALPHRGAGAKGAAAGLDWRGMVDAKLKGFVLLGLEPEKDSADGNALMQALKGAEFVVSLSSFAESAAHDYAQVMLPIGTFAETSGTFVNCEGRWQSFSAAARAVGDSRPGWKVLRVLGNLLDVAGFEYMSSEDVRDEIKSTCADVSDAQTLGWRAPSPRGGDGAVVGFPIYSVDPLVRRSAPLQGTKDARSAAQG